MNLSDNDFITLVEDSSSIIELDEILRRKCKEFGIEKFILHEFLKTDRYKSVYSMSSADLDDWIHFYQENGGYDRFDPIYDRIKNSFLPFYWTKNSFNKLERKQRELFEDMEAFGILSGTTFLLTPQMIKEEKLVDDRGQIILNYRHERFFTVLGQDISNDFELIFKLSFMGNLYNLKKESFSYENFKKEKVQIKSDLDYQLSYNILCEGINALTEKGYVDFSTIYRIGIHSLIEKVNNKLKLF